MHIHIICVLVYVEVHTHKSVCAGERVCARHTQSYMCMYKARKYFTIINTVSTEIICKHCIYAKKQILVNLHKINKIVIHGIFSIREYHGTGN